MQAENKRVGCNQDFVASRRFVGIEKGNCKDWVRKLHLLPCYFALMMTKADLFLSKVNNSWKYNTMLHNVNITTNIYKNNLLVTVFSADLNLTGKPKIT